jgi:phosphoserine phosphatase
MHLLLHSRPMDDRASRHRLSAEDLEAILGVTTALAQPFDLTTMLAEVVNAAKQVLKADRGSVWLYDAAREELVLEVATGASAIRVPATAGLVGACAQSRAVINVPDCYADRRFDPRIDRESGYRTRCMLTLPLIDHRGALVGVMQVLNKHGGVFDGDDETLAVALAAQCAVALQRVRMTDALIEGERLRQELEMAREVQMSTLPSSMPAIPGYEVFGVSRPAEQTGGDTFDLMPVGRGLVVVLGDATGHGIAPALSVTQMQAMLRMAFRLGADLPTAFRHVNDQLAATLADDRFITAFIGVLDPEGHRLEFHSGGQGPILHLSAATGACTAHRPTSFPLGAMPLASLRPPVTIGLSPGDIVLLISDGVYEYHDRDGATYGEARVESVARSHGARPMADLAARILADVEAFAGGAPQQDDVTLVLLARAPDSATRRFPRSVQALPDLVAFAGGFFADRGIDAVLRSPVDFAIEELFTNMVKYGHPGGDAVEVKLAQIAGGVEVTLTDYDVDAFDPTQAPDADVALPIGERKPGGLGIHLTRRLVEGLEYRYDAGRREARIAFRKTVAPQR